MNLNMYIISEWLDEYVTGQRVHAKPALLNITHVEIYRQDIQPENSVLYIVKGSDIDSFSMKGKNCNVITNVLPAQVKAIDQSINVIAVDIDDIVVLLSEIQNVFQKYNDWLSAVQTDLLAVRKVGSTRTIERMVQTSLNIFPSCICVHDSYQQILTIGVQEASKEEDLRKNGYFGSTFSDWVEKRFAAGVKQHYRKEGDIYTRREPEFWEYSDGTRSLGLNIFVQEKFCARIVLTPYHTTSSPSKKDIGPLQVLAKMIGLAFTIDRGMEKDADYNILTRAIFAVIDGERISHDDWEYVCSFSEWDIRDDAFAVCSFSAFCNETSGALASGLETVRQLLFFGDYLRKESYSYHVASRDDTRMVIIDLSKSGRTYKQMVTQFDQAARDNCWRIGLSRDVVGLRRLKSAYREANIVQHYSPREKACGLVTMDDALIPYILKQATEDLPVAMLCPRRLLNLIEYDNNHNTDLYRTLRTYLEQNCSKSATADELFLHRNSLRGRLEKINYILDIDIENYENRLLLLLSFQLLAEAQQEASIVRRDSVKAGAKR